MGRHRVLDFAVVTPLDLNVVHHEARLRRVLGNKLYERLRDEYAPTLHGTGELTLGSGKESVEDVFGAEAAAQRMLGYKEYRDLDEQLRALRRAQRDRVDPREAELAAAVKKAKLALKRVKRLSQPEPDAGSAMTFVMNKEGVEIVRSPEERCVDPLDAALARLDRVRPKLSGDDRASLLPALAALAWKVRPSRPPTPTALAFFSIARHLEPPCDTRGGFDRRVAAWKKRIARAKPHLRLVR